MDFEKLFDMQRRLNQHIERTHKLTKEDLFNKKVLALIVELGELANETRSFKFWSIKPASPKEKIVEEYVDGIHFILSLGIECGFDRETIYSIGHETEKSISDQLLEVYELICEFRNSRTLCDYRAVFLAYLQLGKMLGFTPADIEKAYIDKNEENYKRQAEGY
ncbi:dUTP diphosphatase [Bacillus sp. 22-7]|uniref:dUTP diphosphatase n=1 Tax=Bacillus sp. 22-7 TaxID=2709707 RepID=UPI0013D0C936|nr:dUTP diphosphatase [Bacillus sp. 22-7]